MKVMNMKEVHRELIAALKKEGRDPGDFPIALEVKKKLETGKK